MFNYDKVMYNSLREIIYMPIISQAKTTQQYNLHQSRSGE